MADTQFQEILDDLQNAPWRSHAEELGVIAVLWTKLELYVDVLLTRLMQGTPELVMAVLLANQDLRTKIDTAKVLGFPMRPDDAWFSELEIIMNEINNELRPVRNRYIHDYWLASSTSESLLKVHHKPKLVRPQAREIAIQYHDAKEVKVSELFVFQIKILSVSGRLMRVLEGIPGLPKSLPGTNE